MRTNLAEWLSQQGSASEAVRRGVLQIATACAAVAGLVERAPFDGMLGALGSENVQGETQKALDVASNDVFLEICGREPVFAGFGSEELEDVCAGHVDGELLVAFDPLDGSSNIEISMCVGSIFSILPAPAQARGRAVQEADFYQTGRSQLAAGYALFGPQTLLVLSVGADVCGFTLDRTNDEWILTHPAFAVPEDSVEYAINAANRRHWHAGLGDFVAAAEAGSEGPLGRDFNMRWTGAMVADVHRILVRGGVFIYPADRRPKLARGKLRLMYECSPMGWLIEKAGGLALADQVSVLDVLPGSLHERAPIMLGSRNLVETVRRMTAPRPPEG